MALPVLYVFACVSIVIAFIDLDHHLILNVVLLPTLIATVLLLVVASFGIGEWNRLGRGALCALILFVFYFVLSLIWKGGMGDGDIKLAFILGLLLGWPWLAAIHHWIVRRVLHRRCHQLGIAASKVDLMEASPWPSMLARRMACISPAYQSPHYTCNSPDLRNASAYKTHIYKERP